MLPDEECTFQKALKMSTSTISIIIMAALSVYVTYISFQYYSVYSWHPACFTIASLLIVAEAILALSPDTVLTLLHVSHRASVQLHWILQCAAGVFIIVGFVTIEIYKYKYSVAHLTTWHAITGLISVILFGIGCCDGVLALYSTKFKVCLKPAQTKCIHILVGILSFAFGIISEGFGIYTNWFLYYTSSEIQIVCVLLMALATVFALQTAFVSLLRRCKQSLKCF